MKRRLFCKTSALTAVGSLVLPYILPSGRLFAETGSRKANHVVLCLFAGGVRNIESVHQNMSNLMETILEGDFQVQNGINESLPSSPIGSSRLQNYGTLLKEFRYAQGPTGHFNGHTTAITGRWTNTSLNLKSRPDYPTVFEYYRKHTSPSASALNSWWVANSLGVNTVLNYSNYPGYGSDYGANYIQAVSLISARAYEAIGSPKYLNDYEYDTANNIRLFLNNNFKSSLMQNGSSVANTEDDKIRLRSFFDKLYSEYKSGLHNNPWGFGDLMNHDLYNIFYAEKIIEEFKPELLVVNLTSVDVCHQNFTYYCNNLRLADWGVSHLWNYIQNTPGMEDTIFIVAPEHGRNYETNSLVDSYGRYAIDHTGDDTSREIFCLVCGPSNVIKNNNVINSIYGESIDLVPTIADILGFKNDMPAGMLDGQTLNEVFV
jgi:hypothetical protein